MTTTTHGAAKIGLDILEYVNGCSSEEEAIGAIVVLRDFLEELESQRKVIYWEGVDWGDVNE